MESICDLKKQIADLTEEIKPISKALKYKSNKVTKKEKNDDFLKRFRASQLI